VTSRRRVLAGLGTTVATAAVTGCGYRPGPGDVRWRRDHTGSLGNASETGVAGSRLYAVARSIRGYDFDAEEWYRGAAVATYGTDDGRERWRERLSSPLDAHAVGGDGAGVAFEETVVRFGADGEQWRTTVEGSVLAVGLARDRLYALTDRSALVALADGNDRWSVSLDLDVETGDRSRSFSRIAAGEDVVVCSTGAGVTGVDVDGSRRWTRDDVTAARLLVDRGLILVSTGRRLVALDPDSGDTRWSVGEVVGDVGPTVTSDAVYARSRESLLALARDGTRRWSHVTGRAGQHRPVAAGESGVYLVDRDGLTALDDAGELRWTADYDRLSAGPFLAKSGVIVAADGDLVCHRR